MSRPRYESKHNRSIERQTKDHLESELGVRIGKLPDHYIVDWAFFRNDELIYFAEFKNRKNTMDEYPTYFISLSKVRSGIEWAQATGTGFWLYVLFEDYLTEYEVDPSFPMGFRIDWGGRWDRGDDQDQELLVHIPIDELTVINERAK